MLCQLTVVNRFEGVWWPCIQRRCKSAIIGAVCRRHLTTVQRSRHSHKGRLFVTSYRVSRAARPTLHCKRGVSSTIHRVDADRYINTAAFTIELTDVQDMT